MLLFITYWPLCFGKDTKLGSLPMTMGHTRTGWVFMPVECQQLSTAVEKRWWGLWGGVERKGRKDEGIKLAGSCSWMSSKIKSGWVKKIGGDNNPSLTFERHKSRGAQRETQRHSRQQQLCERTGRGGGCSWHILQLLFLTAIRTCQSLSTCHSSALIGGLSLQIAQIKIPRSRGTGLDPLPLPPHCHMSTHAVTHPVEMQVGERGRLARVRDVKSRMDTE